MVNNLKKVAVLLYPVFLFCVCEIGHMQSVSRFGGFLLNNPGVAVFDVCIIAVLFLLFALLFRRVAVSGGIIGVVFLTVSAVEYYKYNISGTHFTVSDLEMTNNLSDITCFANLRFNWILLACILSVSAYVFLLYRLCPALHFKGKRRFLAAAGLAVMMVISVAQPGVFNTICAFFGIAQDEGLAFSNGSVEFDQNALIASLIVSANESVGNIVRQPDGYSPEAVQSIMAEPVDQSTGQKPNIIFIMSESHGDLRTLEGADIPDGAYRSFDAAVAQNEGLDCVVPSFGGHTVRTEFELLFGLPVKSLNDAPVPTKLLDSNGAYPTFAQIYSDLGYNTKYIHPFSRTFYDRDKVYPGYGFDKLQFADGFASDAETVRGYITDSTVFGEIKSSMASTQGPDYIFATTMQNHQPYSRSGKTELESYLDGVALSDKALLEFFDWVQSFNEDTVVVFGGDHYPCFSKDNSIYNLQFQTDSSALYQQRCVVTSNFGLQIQSPALQSAFYIPHTVYSAIFGEDNAFVNTMLAFRQEVPVYSSSHESSRIESLDMLTYDRTLGKKYSCAF